MADDSSLIQLLLQDGGQALRNGFVNGARNFGDQAMAMLNGQQAPQPYANGTTPNQYVDQNWGGMAEQGRADPRQRSDDPILFRTASPLVNITQGDIDTAMKIGMAAGPGTTVRPYQNVPDTLMGFRKSGQQRGFGDTNYPHTQDVQVTLPATKYSPRDTFADQIEGMNPDHAIERAYRNWPDAINIFAPNKP